MQSLIEKQKALIAQLAELGLYDFSKIAPSSSSSNVDYPGMIHGPAHNSPQYMRAAKLSTSDPVNMAGVRDELFSLPQLPAWIGFPGSVQQAYDDIISGFDVEHPLLTRSGEFINFRPRPGQTMLNITDAANRGVPIRQEDDELGGSPPPDHPFMSLNVEGDPQYAAGQLQLMINRSSMVEDVLDRERWPRNSDINATSWWRAVENTGVVVVEVDKLLEKRSLSMQQEVDQNIKLFSAIEASLKRKDHECFKFWLGVLGDDAVCNLRDGHNRTILHAIAEFGNLADFEAVVGRLRRRRDTDDMGGVAVPIVRLQINNLLNAEDKDGRTALMSAVMAGNEDIVTHLCSKDQALGIAGDILANMEDKLGKTALDHAKESRSPAGRSCSRMAMQLRKRSDVRYYEEERNREMQSWAQDVNQVGKISTGMAITVCVRSIYVAPPTSNSGVLSIILSSVCVFCSVSAAIAALMSMAAPISANMKARIVYLRRLFRVSCLMLCISIFALIADLLIAADNNISSSSAIIKALPLVAIALTVLAICFVSPSTRAHNFLASIIRLAWPAAREEAESAPLL